MLFMTSYNDNPLKDNPFIRIQKKYDQFHKKEKDIADYILKEADQMIYQSVKETALKCGVAESSIVRFCKAIGYSGYSELKTEVAKEAVSIQYQQEILKAENSDSFPEQLGQIFSSTVMLLDQARLQMDYDQIIRTADLILKSRLLLIYGNIYSGQSGFIFSERMKSINVPTFIAWDHISMKQISIMASTDCAAIFLSHSGASKDTLENARLAKSRGAAIIVLTPAPQSPLARLADILITIPSVDVSIFKDYYPVETAFSLILTAIYTAASRQRRHDNSESTEKFETEVINDAFEFPEM